MLEGLAAWILNNYLGKYVYLNTDQLSIALLSGKVELENVPLKTDALRHLGLPVRIRAGFIGKVKLQIPVRQIRSAPWVIAFDKLYVVASPLPLDEWDYESEQSMRHDLKITALDDLEAKWRLEKDFHDSNYYASSYSSWYSYGTGFVSEILENLQLKIQDVHIRYEDSFSNPGKNVAFGITIDSLTAQSCDNNWTPGFVSSGKGDHSYKLLELQNFAIYWDMLGEGESYVNLNVTELAELMNTTKSKKTLKHYIVPSVSAQAHLKRNRSMEPLRSNTTPRIICDLLLEEVPLNIVDWQYNQMVTCVRGLGTVGKLRAYRRYKPCLSIKSDARAWWLYAISCFYPGGQPVICRPKPTWDTCLTRARQNIKYIEIYKKLLITPSVTLTPDEKKLKDDVEFDREYKDLKVLRELAMDTVTLPKENRQKSSRGQSMLESWFPQWMGWYSSSNSESSSSTSPEAKQLEGEILQVLADSADNNTVLKRDVVFGQFTFCLKTGSLNLCTVDSESNETASMLELEFKNLSLTVVSKPRTSSHTVELSLDTLYLKDRITADTMFPVLVGPPGHDRTAMARTRASSIPNRPFSSGKLDDLEQQLFYLCYEKKPLKSTCDYRLMVKTKCLDVVYQPNAVKWLTDFICLPHQRDITQSRIEAMKSRTKKEFIKNWEQILEGRVVARSTWDLELNISAPQIIFVEDFTDQNSAMAVIDFGRLQLRNNSTNTPPPVKSEFITKESEDDETFVTPCSTPPASENSGDSEEQTLEQISQTDEIDYKLNENNFHNKLYDCYSLELNDMQVLVAKAKENWRYALNKGSSTLHVLDRFNISLQIERRVVHTSDPLYPSLTLNANLPKLVFHLNENKISSARNLYHLIKSTGLPTPFNNSENFDGDTVDGSVDNDESISLDTSIEMSRLLMMQFTVDHMSLDLQSRGRSVAELQVAGVKIAFTKRAVDTGITLTVHSLLLVDALQTFGPDFELLVASHKHVGMDSMSGSLRDSEPTSPTSPASPDPNATRQSATSPVALTQALSTLSSDPPKWPGALRNGLFIDTEALITIEICLVSGSEPIHIANIQFNNLDIIANQETIVELVGFVRRVFPKSQKSSNIHLSSVLPSSVHESTESLVESASIGTTQLTFDFHRLNVLLLRGVIKDGVLYGKKICTATMSEAKVHATVAEKLDVEGSLGGLQVLDLTPEGQMHQRIISVGRDLLLEAHHPIYMMSMPQDDERRAFSFKVVRNLDKTHKDKADVTVRMASLWYTHSPKFVVELQSCATEFKQYLSNLARSIRMAATDMALGLVHARAEAIAQSLSMNKRLPSSIYGSALSFAETASPGRRRRRSSSNEPSGFVSARDTVLQTPYSPMEEDDFVIDVKLDIELDSPVLVLPRSHASTEVFVAHLGKIKITNTHGNTSDCLKDNYFYEFPENRKEHYDIEVRDMNIFSLNTSSRRVPGPMICKPEVLYSCKSLAKPILHDTMMQLNIDREIKKVSKSRLDDGNFMDMEEESNISFEKLPDVFNISGSIVTALKVSLTRSQYEQVLDTIQWLTSSPTLNDSQGISRTNIRSQAPLTDISEEDPGVTTLNMDPHVRAKLFSPSQASFQKALKNVPQTAHVVLIGNFEVPIFTVELRGDGPNGEQGLVDLSFRDFIFNYEKCDRYETNIQISLRSIFMEDLLQPEGSRQRSMVISSSGSDPPPSTTCVSKSCPDIIAYHHYSSFLHGSLPDHLETANVFGANYISNAPRTNGNLLADPNCCPTTPPPSPSIGRKQLEKNLVLISSLIVDPAAPNFDSHYNSTERSTSVDFSCLDLVMSVPSWVVVIDFFSGSNTPNKYSSTSSLSSSKEDHKSGIQKKVKAVTNISVCSLTVVLVKPDMEIARANISTVEVMIKTWGLYKEVNGKLGSMSLFDMTLHGQIYRERFLTSGKEALQFQYTRHPPDGVKEYDAQLKLDMASVMYVHTKRFIAEIQAFFNKFIERQATVMKGIQAATSGKLASDEPFRLSLNLNAGSPIILLPVSSKSTNLLIIDLGQLLVTNSFKFSGDEGTISALSDSESHRKCLLELMLIDLQNLDLYTGVKDSELSPTKKSLENSFKFGSSFIMRKGPSLLKKKFELKLQYERNLYKNFCHIVPDSSIYGHLSTLDCALDLNQYKLIRGLLTYNLGEDTERICPSVNLTNISIDTDTREEWIISCIKLDMQNVVLRLIKSHSYQSSLTCINFIKSHLTVETFSNLSQDVDLVSQEILILDTRSENNKDNQNKNVFMRILQPITNSAESHELVQAEIHSRRRQDHAKVTILLNNMRLMAIFDWWETLREYIFQEIENVQTSPEHQRIGRTQSNSTNLSFEVKLNVTDSELVLVEDSSQWDTNAVILKSTTVIKYRPNNVEKPLSCSLNNCEMFSCILGIEDDTALSIIDPITLNVDIIKDSILDIQLQFLTVRLSYHDMCMFKQMLDSLPKQFLMGRNKQMVGTPSQKNNVISLRTLGFENGDCIKALELSDNNLNDAAIWLTQNAKVLNENKKKAPLDIRYVEVKANCISICIIDDCGDSDVPLIELLFSDLEFRQELPDLNMVNSKGHLRCSLASDYYNRVLSGWEPVIEPWLCKIMWEKTLSQNRRNRLQLKIESEHTFNFNITSTFMDLYKQVKESWMDDFLKMTRSEQKMAGSFKRRSPFIPFALKNDTGSSLRFTLLTSDLNTPKPTVSDGSRWISAEPGETIPFSFTNRAKLRHQNSHKLLMHYLTVKIDGWHSVDPVTIDKVGTYFRDTPADVLDRNLDIPPARVVFDVTLEGSARKLVTVRSGLKITNYLSQSIEMKLESRLPHDFIPLWLPKKNCIIESKATLAIPLDHAHSLIKIKPLGLPYDYTFSNTIMTWNHLSSGAPSMLLTGSCHTHKGHNFNFCAHIFKEKMLIERNTKIEQPYHRIVLHPTILLVNLLPVEMQYVLSGESNIVKPGSNAALTHIDFDRELNMEIRLENFKMTQHFSIPLTVTETSYKVRLEDRFQRKLFLCLDIHLNRDAKLKISVSVPYWIVNKTGLPIVFKHTGSSSEAAGQFDEHEQARMVSPLLFSFPENDSNQVLSARVGKRVFWDGTPQWCGNIHLQKGTQYRKLHVTMHESRNDRIFMIGIEVRSGRGRYRGTTVVSISPRFQLHNKSSYNLAFAQSFMVKNVSDNTYNRKMFLKAVPNSYFPFHWSSLDKSQLLCVSIEDIPDCCWSGGFKIDADNSMHINVRDANSRVYFLRLEVVLQGPTYYVVFTDADTMPPPIRIDNFSEVSIIFGQSNCEMLSTARAHSSVPYAWDEPTKPNNIKLIAPGGVSHTYSLNNLGSAKELTYENFIYIAFVGTFKNNQKIKDPHDVESQELVLDVVKNNRVILARKIPGQRSQLWKCTSEGYLQHEGSIPPTHPSSPVSKTNVLVLDIADTAPQPNYHSRLTLRRIDPRRLSTQRWQFSSDGRLCCGHCNMCVQSEDGFFGLREGSLAVLGLTVEKCHKLTDKGVPIEQAVEPQRLRPGSGVLTVNISMDGPTQVITIKDIKEKRMYALPDDREWGTISQRPRLTIDDDKKSTGEFQFNLNLKGIGISVVNRTAPEELIYAHFSHIIGETIFTSQSKQICLSIKDLQIDNQLLDAQVPVVLYITPPKTNEEASDYLPAIDLNSEIQHQDNQNAVIFKHLILRLKKITAILEEKLFLKLIAFIGFHSDQEEVINKEESDYETQRLLSEVSAASAKRYYFGVLKLIPGEIRLSVRTSSRLSGHLHKIKKKLGLTLIKFEDATINLNPFDRKHPFETSQFLYNSVIKHFKAELVWQAAVILGSIDFIGNPLGLMNDVSEGVSGLIYEGNVSALVKNVTHGLSNSAAKVTESLSDGLGKIAMDDYHEEMRQKIRQVETGKSADHLLAGMKGFGFGLLGGATSIFKQVYEGVSSDGLQGMFTGFGKGVVGAVTKPVVGVLDLASEAARAVRDSSRRQLIRERKRLPRCVYGPGSLLPRFDSVQSQGQLFLYIINDKNYDEKLLAYQVLKSGTDDLLCIVSDKMIRIVTGPPELTTVIPCHLSNLEACNVVKDSEKGETKYYIEIVMHHTGVNAAVLNPDPIKKPRVRCSTADLAVATAQQINCAKMLYVENEFTLISEESNATMED
ncbi:hypothetical protein GWI33_006075 [Rhynchophorus ferrugineus]|uniref:UBA domain-containing protein n=1 Tax=Rhynchophorus ferrugineus TaxID=354439 RepID=A0A834MJ78_RHYFE|nr:hypothetical protein GWI33_006075 [Rhynchophorus ferrugineus]